MLRPGDEPRVTIHRRAVQDVEDEVFASLGAGDVLFVDSTHVVKAGSDVNHLVFEVFPRLAQGVWIHLPRHLLPVRVPGRLGARGRAWHEGYLLRAFLSFNPHFAIRWFQDFLWQHHREALLRMPAVAAKAGGNIWLRAGELAASRQGWRRGAPVRIDRAHDAHGVAVRVAHDGVAGAQKASRAPAVSYRPVTVS